MQRKINGLDKLCLQEAMLAGDTTDGSSLGHIVSKAKGALSFTGVIP